MTVGERIAQKRKELGLSQEALGERLGVSRQAIYKWESDAALPEVEKLVSLSRIFSISVGCLLGVEESSAEEENTELTETQLQMVKEIAERYMAAQPAQEKVRRRRWPWIAAVICLVFVCAGVFSLLEELNSLNRQTQYLQSTVTMLENSVAHQVGSITDRVEEILKSQNDLTADYTTEYLGMDDTGTMGTFSWRAVPKTYQEGTVAYLDVVNEYARITFGPYEPIREVFSGEVTVALSDSTDLYIVFEYDGVKQTQLLESYRDLKRESYPVCWLDAWPLHFELNDKTNTLNEDLDANLVAEDYGEALRASVADYRIGLFADQQLVRWFEPGVKKVITDGVTKEEETFVLKSDGIVFDRGKTYCIAAVVTDDRGREFVVTDVHACWRDDRWAVPRSYETGPFFEGWNY